MEGLKKYKWLYLWIVAAAALTFGLLMLLLKEFGQSVVFAVSGVLLIVYVCIRFVPLIKTLRTPWGIAVNAIELFIDLLVGVLILVSVFKSNVSAIAKLYPFMIGGVLFLRGLVYLTEISFFNTKPEALKFIIHIVILTAGAIVIGRFDSFTTESLRWLIGLAFTLGGAIAGIDGGSNYNEYRKHYSKPKKKEKVKNDEAVDDPVKNKKNITDEIPVTPLNDEDEGPTIVA